MAKEHGCYREYESKEGIFMEMCHDVITDLRTGHRNMADYDGFAAASYSVVNDVTESFSYLLPRGFKLYSEIDLLPEAGGEIDLYHAEFSSGTAGSFAHAKMQTLIDFPHKPITGEETPQDLIDMIMNAPNADSEDARAFIKRLGELESLSQMTRADHELLRDEWDLSVFHGGVRFPFSIDALDAKMEMKLAFSGAPWGWQDLCIVFHIFKFLQSNLVQLYGNHGIKFSFTDLQQIATANTWLKVYLLV